MSKELYKAIEDRRTIYGISKESTISDERIEEIINHAAKHVPSAFNSQSARVVLLLNKEHDELWNLVLEALRPYVPEENFAATQERIDSFKNGYGTVLYFEDQNIVESLQERFSLYKDNFPIWSQQSSGMLQYAIWTALEAEGLGASLQHYSEVVDAQVKARWEIPNSWKFIAQMPFGKPVAEPGEKEYFPVEDRVKIFR